MPISPHKDLEWFKGLGKEPRCLGHHVPGHAECDSAPCAFRLPCQALQGYCKETKADVDATKKALPEALKASLLRDRLQMLPGREAFFSIKHVRMWERFVAIFSQALGLPVMPTRESAAVAELYWQAKYGPKSQMPKYWSIMQRTTGVVDAPVCSMMPGSIREMAPHLLIRASLVELMDVHPQVEPWAEKWMQKGDRGEDGTWVSHFDIKAVRVSRTRIDDLARLVARLLKDGRIKTCSWPLDGKNKIRVNTGRAAIRTLKPRTKAKTDDDVLRPRRTASSAILKARSRRKPAGND